MNRAESDVARFAQTNFRNERKVFGIKRADRRAHMYVVGKTGTGKSTLIETLIAHDLESGEGLAVFDPHGDLIQRLLSRVPERRRSDLICFNAPEPRQPLGFNPLERVPVPKRPLAASALLDAFKKLWADSWGPRLEHVLRNALLGLLDQPSATLADVLPLLMDRNFRRVAITHMMNPQVRTFWSQEYEGYPAKFRAEAIAPILAGRQSFAWGRAPTSAGSPPAPTRRPPSRPSRSEASRSSRSSGPASGSSGPPTPSS